MNARGRASRDASPSSGPSPAAPRGTGRRERRRPWKKVGLGLALLVVVLAGVRWMLPDSVRWYVNRVVNRSNEYEGTIGDVRLQLWRGAYSIHDVQILRRSGNVPVPLFSAERVDLALDWRAAVRGKLSGRVSMQRPQVNLVDEGSASRRRSGPGPWLGMIEDLFPFDIDRAVLEDGVLAFRAFHTSPPVDVYLEDIEGSVANLENTSDQVLPLFALVEASGLAMGQARVELEAGLDPRAYHPTFDLALRLVGLDVTELNSLARAYGGVDFEAGRFDLVVELNAGRGTVEGYIKPLFRGLRVFDPSGDLGEGAVNAFWQALVGGGKEIFENPLRDQLAAVIPLQGELAGPDVDLLRSVASLLRNAFVRAYIPDFERDLPDPGSIIFGPAVLAGTPGGESKGP